MRGGHRPLEFRPAPPLSPCLLPRRPRLAGQRVPPAPVRGGDKTDCEQRSGRLAEDNIALTFVFGDPSGSEHRNRASASAFAGLPAPWSRAALSSSHASRCRPTLRSNSARSPKQREVIGCVSVRLQRRPALALSWFSVEKTASPRIAGFSASRVRTRQ